MKHDFQTCAFSYLLALATVTSVLIYGLNLPTLVTGNVGLVKEYYYNHYMSSFLLDVVLIAVYLGIAYMVSDFLKISSFVGEWMMVLLGTFFISGGFYLYFLSRPQTNMFFSRWFHSVKFMAVIYDMILVSSVFVVKKVLDQKLE